jgi:hypothetical protein
MPELQPKMRDALLAAYRTPSRSLRRACGGYIATGAPIRTSGPVLYQAFTIRTLNRLENAGLVAYDTPEFPTCITLTDAGVREANELAKADSK